MNKYGIEVTKNFLFGDPVMIAEIPGTGRAWLWHGGSYIDEIRRDLMNGTLFILGESWSYSDMNINVWDYEKGRSSIKFNDSDALITLLTEWMDS
jgi:hypothetical protein